MAQVTTVTVSDRNKRDLRKKISASFDWNVSQLYTSYINSFSSFDELLNHVDEEKSKYRGSSKNKYSFYKLQENRYVGMPIWFTDFDSFILKGNFKEDEYKGECSIIFFPRHINIKAINKQWVAEILDSRYLDEKVINTFNLGLESTEDNLKKIIDKYFYLNYFDWNIAVYIDHLNVSEIAALPHTKDCALRTYTVEGKNCYAADPCDIAMIIRDKTTH